MRLPQRKKLRLPASGRLVENLSSRHKDICGGNSKTEASSLELKGNPGGNELRRARNREAELVSCFFENQQL